MIIENHPNDKIATVTMFGRRTFLLIVNPERLPRLIDPDSGKWIELRPANDIMSGPPDMKDTPK